MGMKKGQYLRYVPLIILISLIFFVINPSFFQNSLDSSTPNSFLASDAYAHLAYIDDVIENGNYNHESQFYVGFTGDEFSPREPPLMLFYVAFISNLFGIESHVAALFGLLLGIVLSISIIYVILNKFNWILAVLFLPVTLFLFTNPFVAGITWGFWKAYFMYFILVVGFLFFLTKLTKERAILLVLILSSLILASPALLMFFLLLFTFKLILEWSELKRNIITLLITGITSLIITSHYFLNYYVARTSGSSESKLLSTLGFAEGYHLYGANPYASNFGIFWYVALVGFMLALFYLIQNWKNRGSYKYKTFFLFTSFFIIFLLPLIGLTRINQFRLVWPLFIAFFIGLTGYFIIIFLTKKIVKLNKSIITLFAFAILILLMFNILEFSDNNMSITSPEYWDNLMYLHDLIIDPSLTQNSIVLSANRRMHYYDFSHFSQAQEEQVGLEEINSHYYCAIPEKSRDGLTIYTNEDEIEYCERRRDSGAEICSYDYILINKQYYDQEHYILLSNFINTQISEDFEMVNYGDQIILLKNINICEEEM